MNFTEYQALALTTAIYPGIGSNFIYPTLGLAGESGEVAEKVKKVLRDAGGWVSPETKDALKSELGDVLWYVAMLCHEIDLNLDDVAEANITKLENRQAHNTLHGSGDNR